MIRIGLICAHNPYDRNNFSGTVYYIHQALMRAPGVEVRVVGAQFHQARSLSSRAYKSLNNGRFASLSWVRDRLFRQFLGVIERELNRTASELDLLIAPVASEIVGSLRLMSTWPPLIFVTDATPQFIRETYPQPVEDIAFDQERKVLSSCSKVVYSSHFMAERARKEFHDILDQRSDKVEVVPFGLNMDKVPAQHHAKQLSSPLELLFVGKDWQRKGGSVAVDMLRALMERGIDARLTIVGCQPAISGSMKNITVIPYLDKNIPEQQRQHIEILKRSHFFVLPTRADCTPMVIAEANAFGVPALVADVGGIATLVQNGVNGFLMPANAPGFVYADKVIDILANAEKYPALASSSRRTYEDRLNWDAWTRKILELGKSIADPPMNLRPNYGI